MAYFRAASLARLVHVWMCIETARPCIPSRCGYWPYQYTSKLPYTYKMKFWWGTAPINFATNHMLHLSISIRELQHLICPLTSIIIAKFPTELKHQHLTQLLPSIYFEELVFLGGKFPLWIFLPSQVWSDGSFYLFTKNKTMAQNQFQNIIKGKLVFVDLTCVCLWGRGGGGS